MGLYPLTPTCDQTVARSGRPERAPVLRLPPLAIQIRRCGNLTDNVPQPSPSVERHARDVVACFTGMAKRKATILRVADDPTGALPKSQSGFARWPSFALVFDPKLWSPAPMKKHA
jgi:hypothetical protein